MKRILLTTLTLAAALVGANHARGQTATLTDMGPIAPTPGPNDVAQLGVTTDSTPTDLNYYFDNANPPGQTFTTGNNPGGYLLKSVWVLTDGNSGGIPAAGQAYELRLYSVAGTSATLQGTFPSQGGFLFTDYDWLQWIDLGTNKATVLAPNTQYAYTMRRTSGGWGRMASTGGDPYPAGQAVLIPQGGGALVTSPTAGYDATFLAELTPLTSLTLTTPTATPGNVVVTGTPVTLSVVAGGGSTYTYQWQTDGGTGGTLTNIPGATSASLAVDTTMLPIAVNWRYALVVTSGSASATSTITTVQTYVQGGATLTDRGTAEISPGPNDISQLVGGGTGDTLNYYHDNNPPPGQTFTTGSNPQGYYLTSVTLGTGGGSSGNTLTLQGYNLWIYSVSGNTATLLVNLTNASFAFTYGDWLTWGGFTPITLKPNTTYAYAFRRNTSGWAGMSSSPTTSDLYPGGQLCLIPQTGGTITFGATGTSDAAFDLGLLPIGVGPSPYPFATAIDVAPARFVVAGSSVTLSEAATGAAPLHYLWRTDGGSGGALTNIPANDSSNLVLNTTGWVPGLYKYAVVITNVYGAATSTVATLTLTFADTTAVLTDIGATDPQPAFGEDIVQLSSGAGNPPGINYYFDNANPPGQTFTTGNNPKGYTLTTLAVRTAGGSGELPAAGQMYRLRLYSVSGDAATLYATFSSQTNFTFTDLNWLRWSGLAVPLAPNQTYAYTFARLTTGSGWEKLDNTSGNPYAGGRAVLIPANGGAMGYGTAGSEDYDATFVVGLAVAGYPNVMPPVFAPAASVYAGTPVTVTASVTGTGPFTYRWQTDTGNPGVFSDIPGATGPTLTVNTTGLDYYTLNYRLVATSSAGATIGEPATLTVLAASAPQLVGDITSTPSAAFVGNTVTFSAAFAGTLPITYQWRLDKGSGPVNLPGQTSATLTITNATPANLGAYSVHAVNAVGSTDSSSAMIYPQPAGPLTMNFQWHSTENGNDVGDYAGPGVPGFGTGTFWNQVIGPNAWNPGTFSSTNAYADDGTTLVGAKWTLVTGGSWDWASAPALPLLFSSASAYAKQNFTFTLPNGRYNLVLFSCNGTEATQAKGGTLFTLNGLSQTALPTQNTSFVEGNTCVVFSNVLVTSNTLAGTWEPVAGKDYGSLNGAQLQYLGPAVSLTLNRLPGGQVQLQWPAGTLLEAGSLNGPWTTNTAASPYTPSATTGQKFYRLILR